MSIHKIQWVLNQPPVNLIVESDRIVAPEESFPIRSIVSVHNPEQVDHLEDRKYRVVIDLIDQSRRIYWFQDASLAKACQEEIFNYACK
jgi:hypothetical protein